MRMIIKNADFSSVSIGKVEKDLSFYYYGESINAVLDNPIDDWSNVDVNNGYSAGTGHNGNTTFYIASSGDTEYTVYADNPNRLTTELFEVAAGMVINIDFSEELPTNMPTIVCYNENGVLLTPSVASWTSPYTIPDGVKYIKFQFARINRTASFGATMPE